jgi:melibiose permease/lactose/raffinose/galactose permease
MTDIKDSALTDRIDKRSKWSYCFGGIGRDMAYNLYSAWLFTYILLTNQISVEQQLTLSAFIIISKLWDGINDPIMGFIIERTRTKIGKFKPWILAGTFASCVVIMLMFTSSTYNMHGWGYISFMCFLYFMWSMTYTMNDISYWSMLPSLTSNNEDRNSLASWANLLAGAGAGLAMVTIPMFTAGKYTIGGNNKVAFAVIAAIVCLFFIGFQLLTFFGVKEKHAALPDANEEKIRFSKILKIIKNNDQLRWTAIVMLIYNVAANILVGFVTIYVYMVYGYEGSLVTLFTVVYGIMGALPMLLFPMLAKKLGRRKMIWVCIGTSLTGYLLFFLMGFITNSAGFYLLAACGVLINFGQSLFYNILTINISNSVEYNEWKTGTRDEGIIFSLRPLMAKFGSAIQMGVLSLTYAILNITDITNAISRIENGVFQGIYTETEKPMLIAAELLKVNPSTVLWLRVIMVFVPFVLLLAAVLTCLKKCTIDEKKYEQILKELAERKQMQK